MEVSLEICPSSSLPDEKEAQKGNRLSQGHVTKFTTGLHRLGGASAVTSITQFVCCTHIRADTHRLAHAFMHSQMCACVHAHARAQLPGKTGPRTSPWP